VLHAGIATKLIQLRRMVAIWLDELYCFVVFVVYRNISVYTYVTSQTASSNLAEVSH